MSQITVQTTHASLQELTANDLDNIRDSIETFVNVTKLNGDNIQDNSITASTKFTPESIDATKIAASAITTVKITDLNVTTAKIADEAVTTEKIANNNVTNAKLTSFNYALGSDIAGSNSTTTDALMGTVTITTTGRPVRITLAPDSSNNAVCSIRAVNSNAGGASFANFMKLSFTLKRDDTTIALSATSAPSLANQFGYTMPGTYLSFFETPAAGTYVYKLYMKTNFTATETTTVTGFVSGRLLAYEI